MIENYQFDIADKDLPVADIDGKNEQMNSQIC